MNETRTFEWLGVILLTAITLTVQSALPMWAGIPLNTILEWGLVYLVLRHKRTGLAWIGVGLMLSNEVIRDCLLIAGPSGWWHNTAPVMARVTTDLMGWNLAAWALYVIGWRFLITANARPKPAASPPPQFVHHLHHGLPTQESAALGWHASEAFPAAGSAGRTAVRPAPSRQAIAAAPVWGATARRPAGRRVMATVRRGVRNIW